MPEYLVGLGVQVTNQFRRRFAKASQVLACHFGGFHPEKVAVAPYRFNNVQSTCF